MKRQRDATKTKSGNLSTKIEPLPGAVDARFVRCGKANCKCAKGELHGPYFVRRWREGGQRHSKYVRKRDVLTVKMAIEARRNQQGQARQQMREALRTLRLMKSRLFYLLSEAGL